MSTYTLKPGQLDLNRIHTLAVSNSKISLSERSWAAIRKGRKQVQKVLASGQEVYGINTGFGKLADMHIADDKLRELQKRLVLSHSVGVGEHLSDEVVRIILLLKINSLARGLSGVSEGLVKSLLALFNHQVYPCIPAQGSVGASGDLAPLAHLSAALLGQGKVRAQGKVMSAKKGLAIAKLKPIELLAKEGLALLNGTQVSTAISLSALFKTVNVFKSALVTGCLTLDAVKGSDKPFDKRIQAVRGQPGQIAVAAVMRRLLRTSAIRASHLDCDRVQDPYSIRCQPQVMGACLDQINHVAKILLIEANAVTDNPLVFTDEGDILSGGNFHAEPVAMAADILALAIAEVGALSERRIALMMDKYQSGLPAFLIAEAGINSGFMISQYTAAAVASENKSYAHPACVDSVPTSANQEDHVSMATGGAMRLLPMIENTGHIVAIEWLAACQGIDFHAPLKSSKPLQQALAILREHVKFYTKDRYFQPDILKAKQLIDEGALAACIKKAIIPKEFVYV